MALQEETGATVETTDQEPQNQTQEPTVETTDTGETPTVETAPKEPTKLSDNHPLVKTLAVNKTQIADLKRELAEARAQSGQATKLQEELDKRPSQETLDTLQARYDRLEAFATAVGLGKALDSRTFTRDLFESGKDVADLVKDWYKSHPTVTSTALGAGSSEPASGKQDPNALLRIAAGK